MTEFFLFMLSVYVFVDAMLGIARRATTRRELAHLRDEQSALEAQIAALRSEMLQGDVGAVPLGPFPARSEFIEGTEIPTVVTAQVEIPPVEIPQAEIQTVQNQVIEESEADVASVETLPIAVPNGREWEAKEGRTEEGELTTEPSSVPPVPKPTFDWESLIGVRLFSWVAGIALLVAAIGFLRYSLDHGWLGPPVRMAVGLLTGIGLLIGCETKRAQRYQITAHALTAAGIATLFATFFAAHALWHLVESAVLTFALLALVAAVAVLLSIRRNSMFIALLGLLGGFATPILLSSGEDRPFSLFGYLLLLNVGLSWVAYKKRWPSLAVLSLVFTSVYQVGWMMRFFDETRMPLAMGIFLVFPMAGLAALLLHRRREATPQQGTSLFTISALCGAGVPVLFSVYLSMTPACAANFGLLFGFVFLIALGLAVVSVFIGPEWVHLMGAGAVLMVMAGFLGRGYDPSRLWGVSAFTALFIAFYLGAPHLLKRLGRSFVGDGRFGVYAASLLLFVFPVIMGVSPSTEITPALFGVLFVLTAAISAYAVRFENGPLHFLAAIFVLIAEVVWSAAHLGPDRLLTALLVYGGFGLFYFGVPLLAERIGKKLRPEGSAAAALLAALLLLFFLTTSTLAAASLPILALLLLIFNGGLLFEASRGRRPILAMIGMAVSFVVLGCWWGSAPLMTLFVPALAVLVGFVLLVFGGCLYVRHRAKKEGFAAAAGVTDYGLSLGLTGHLFLFAVAVQPELVVWFQPWLAVLAVLTLAAGVVSLQVKNGALHLASVSATGVILIAWISATLGGTPPSPFVPIISATVLGLFGFIWTLSAERRGALPGLFVIAAGVSICSADILVTISTNALWPAYASGQGLPYAAHLAAHLVLLLSLLIVSARSRVHAWSFGGGFLLNIAVLVWYSFHPSDWFGLLGLATPIYLLFIANPLVLGPRAVRDWFPFVTALVASVFYFFFARSAMISAGAAGIIGILPVAQALLLLPHVRLLRRMDAPSKRDTARLALMAGAVLAFVTVAIPLQLEKQWITLGWACQGAALAWLYRRIPHRGILWWLSALLATIFVRLTVNPAVLVYHAREGLPILNWYLYTWLTAAACCFAAGRFLRTTDDRLFHGVPRMSRLLYAAGAVLLFWLLNIEITDFFSEGDRLRFSFSAGLAQNLSYTIGWGLFAIGLLVGGVISRSRPARVAAIILLAITVLKAFLFDLSGLEGLYRVASFAGLAVCLVLVAVVLQRFVLRMDKEEKAS